MINIINKIKSLFLKDYMNYYGEKIIALRKKIINSKSKIRKFFLIRKYNKYVFKCHSYFPLSKRISNNITFPHGIMGVFISNNAVINDGCTIFQQVTIGSNNLSDSKSIGAPTIGKNCYIGAGAKIIGNVNIGDNCRIGANVTITKDVPANSTVVNSPFRIIKHNKVKDNTFIPINVK